MNGLLLVRIAGIIVGIATLLRVATNEGIVTYDPLFLAWMDCLSDIVELGFLTKLIGPFLHWGIDVVRGLGISVPDLQDEWRPAFVFSMLLFGAVARHSRGGWLLAVAPVGALAVAVWAGLSGSLAPVAFVAAAAVVVAVVAAAVVAPVAVAVVAAAVVVYLFAGFVESRGGGWRALLANSNFNIGIDILFTMAISFVIAVAAANPPIW